MPWVFGDHMVLQCGKSVPVWGQARAGERIEVSFRDQKKTATADARGAWRVTLDPMMPTAQPADLIIRDSVEPRAKIIRDVVVGEVWLAAGQSNMAFTLRKSSDAPPPDRLADDGLRLLLRKTYAATDNVAWNADQLAHATPELFFSGAWEVAGPKSAPEFSAVAHAFARYLRGELKIPVGVICVAVGGAPVEAFISRAGLSHSSVLKTLAEQPEGWLNCPVMPGWPLQRAQVNLAQARKNGVSLTNHPYAPSFIYRANIAVLAPFALRGVIWYQGESNATDAENLQPLPVELMRAGQEGVIRDWRSAWNDARMPFIYVQLPSLNRPWMEFRDMQRRMLEIPGTGMAVALDQGHASDVHPRQKTAVGERLARWALGTVYGQKIVYSGPLFRGVTREGASARVSFDHVGGGLAARGSGAIRGFELAGKDGPFAPAKATVLGNTLILSAQNIMVPEVVRYAWAPIPEANLINREGLPASPFRARVSGTEVGPTQKNAGE